jgi:uncharacterized SAM-binding protein YcdF (DUF218 family)
VARGPRTLRGMSGPAIVVLGNGSLGRDGTYRITRACRRLVAEAEREAVRVGAGVVVFTGWSPYEGPSEAAQMRDLWRGPDADLVVEETASSTAENAARTLPLLRARGVTSAVVVCAPIHVVRARLIFRNLYRRHAVSVRFRTARIGPTPGALVWELGALTVVAHQLRAMHAELDRVAEAAPGAEASVVHAGERR